MAQCLLGLGSNLGDREATLEAALAQICDVDGIQLHQRSRWYPSQPIGGPAGQGEYLNGAALVETSLDPTELLRTFQQVETHLGRERDHQWAARTIDIDLLLYDQLVLASAELTIPHPRMSFRRFVLEPAVEIAGNLVHPLIHADLSALLHQLDRGNDYLVIRGGDQRAREELILELLLHFPALSPTRSPSSSSQWCNAVASWLKVEPLAKQPPSTGADAAGPNPMQLASDGGVADLPKLAIVLNCPPPSFEQHSPAVETIEQAYGICAAAPTLVVDRRDERQILSESLAAVEAVWPWAKVDSDE